MIPTVTVTSTVTDAAGNTVQATSTCEVYPSEQWILDNLGPRIPLVKVTRDYTLAPGEVLHGLDITGRVSWSGADSGIVDCIVRGNIVPPTNGGMVQATNANVSGGIVDHCIIIPTTKSYKWGAGFAGHGTRMSHTLIADVVDGVQIKKSNTTWPADNNMEIQYCLIEDLLWWTAGSPNVVHTTDTETHADGVQAMQFGNADISWNIFRARFARQTGHWIIRRKSDGYIYKRSEVTNALPPIGEWEQIPLNSLPDGGPWRTIPDRGSGTEADGRYNGPRVSTVDSNNGDLSVLMIGDEEGKPTFNLKFIGNRCYGGFFAVNGGGNGKPATLPAGMKMGVFELNLFDKSQGSPTQTLNFQGSGWTAADATVPTSGIKANRYMVPGDPDARTGAVINTRF
jgi:hypothetical protein